MKVVRKFDKVGFRRLKKVCRKFIRSQKDEYLMHQARQLELFEEQQEDLMEFDDKMVELEVKIEQALEGVNVGE